MVDPWRALRYPRFAWEIVPNVHPIYQLPPFSYVYESSEPNKDKRGDITQLCSSVEVTKPFNMKRTAHKTFKQPQKASLAVTNKHCQWSKYFIETLECQNIGCARLDVFELVTHPRFYRVQSWNNRLLVKSSSS